MRCPRCGAEVVGTSGEPARCACGWDAGAARYAGVQILAGGLVLDLAGTAALAWSLLGDRAYLPAGIVLLAVGGTLPALGALRLARAAGRGQGAPPS